MDKTKVLEKCIDLLHMETYKYSDSLKLKAFPYYNAMECKSKLKELEEMKQYLKENLK